jgi:hypothetical protein
MTHVIPVSGLRKKYVDKKMHSSKYRKPSVYARKRIAIAKNKKTLHFCKVLSSPSWARTRDPMINRRD